VHLRFVAGAADLQSDREPSRNALRMTNTSGRRSLVVRIAGALHHHAAELHYDMLIGERACESELEDTRIRIGEPVILDQFFRDDVRRVTRPNRCPECQCSRASIPG